LILLRWRSTDLLDPALSLEGWSWRGWLAQPPPNWEGAIPSLLACSPQGCSAKAGANPSASEGDERWLNDVLFPMRPSGALAPWINSDSIRYQDMSSPRILVLGLHWDIPSHVPRSWSDEWHTSMGNIALGAPGAKIEATLSSCGFSHIEPLGTYHELTGEDNWINVAAKRWDAWAARAEHFELTQSTPPSEIASRSKSAI
jgi:hypothetical protein